MTSPQPIFGQWEERAGTKCQHVRDIDLLDKLGLFIKHGAKPGHHIDVWILGEAAHDNALIMRCPASKDGAHISGLCLHRQGIYIMFDRGNDYIRIFDTELIRFIPGCKREGILRLHQTQDFILNSKKILILSLVVSDCHNIYIVERTEVVEMEYMVIDVFRTHGQIPEQCTSPRYFSPECSV